LLVDALVVAIFAIPAFIYGTLGPTTGEPCPHNPLLVCKVPSDSTRTTAWVLFGLALIAGFVYQVVFDARGGTVGKRIFDLEVVDRETGEPIGRARAVTRALARLLSLLALGLGFLAMLWDPQRRTWHDRLTDTSVLRLEDPAETAVGQLEAE
jgi:uncharacterized RDD family membrane protein YckC